MPKMRGIKPEIWTDEKFVELPPFGRLLFVGMWHYACDNGHLDDKPKQLKMRVLPVDDIDAADLIDQMVDLGMVERSRDGLTVPKLRDHQRLDNRYFTWCDRCELDEIPEPARSKHPDYTTGARERSTDTRSGNDEARVKEGRKEGEGEGEGVALARPSGRKRPARHLPSDFQPTEDHVAIALGLGVDLDHEFAKFCDYWQGEGKAKADWNATLRNWLRRAGEDRKGNPRPAPVGGSFPHAGTDAEKDAWVKAQPRPADGTYYGGSRR